MGDLVCFAQTSFLGDPWSFETLSATSGERAARIFARQASGESRLSRMLIAVDQPHEYLPNQAKPQLPEIQIDEALSKRPTHRNFGPSLIPSQLPDTSSQFWAQLNPFSTARYIIAILGPA